jgi:L-2,4-diaminobutyric acid acetyltransferase
MTVTYSHTSSSNRESPDRGGQGGKQTLDRVDDMTEKAAALTGEITFREPTNTDAALMWRVARESGVLEENSEYVYNMFCHFFPRACVVAEVDGEPAGFIAGLFPPEQPDTVFVWQIAVDHAFRGRRIARLMLAELIRRNSSDIRYLEATVTPSNDSSRIAFEGFARACGAGCARTVLFPAHEFAGPADEDEVLFRIGPIDPDSKLLRATDSGSASKSSR